MPARTNIGGMVSRLLAVTLGLVLPAGLAGQTASAAARDPARWLRVDRRPGVVVYIDRLRTHPIDSSYVETWVRWDIADSTFLKLPRKKVDQMVTRWAIDCRRLDVVDVEDAFYYRGALVEHYVIPVAQRTITTTPPEGAGETLISAACLTAKGLPVDTVP